MPPLLLAVLLAAVTPARAQQTPSPADARLVQALKAYIPHVMRQSGTPGLSIALARGGQVIWEEGFGYADLEKKIPMTARTVLRSGSMGKTYTATALMQLVERGLLSLHDPINKYLKDFQVTNPLGEREITVYDLLTHRSGLAGNTAGSDFAPPQPLADHLRQGYQQKMFEWYQGTAVPRWTAKVGEKFQYSNFGLATLGYLVEVVNPEGISFSAYVQKYIIDPLGMTSTQYPPVQDAAHVRPDIFRRLSTGYARFGPVHLPTPDIYFADYPAGVVVTTVGDHIRLLLAYLNQGRYNGYQLLKPETVRLMLTPQTERPERGVTVGLIWNLRNVGQPDFSFGHGGAHMFGWNNDFRAYPEQDFALVVATNQWDMVYWGDPLWQSEPALIADFVSAWLANQQHHLRRTLPPASWTWKTSYVIGLMMAERLKGFLGVPSPVTAEMIEALARGARVRVEAENGVAVWDEAGFRAGMQDMLSVEMTPAAIREFLRSDRLRVAPEELFLLYRELGGLRDFPLPAAF